MRVIGLMSGTSADGIDAALVSISGAPPRLSARLDGHSHSKFPARVRRMILRIADGAPTSSAEISQLNFLLGEEFARAAIEACRRWRVPLAKIDLIGSHGQTIFHQGSPSRFAGARRVASTLQIGEPGVIAVRTGVTTIADFRPADMAAGGQGAPLVPFVDFLLYRHAKIGRAALNIGGIANVSVIPASAEASRVLAFDTGPGNMIIDALVDRFTRGRLKFDRDSRIALRGKTVEPLLRRMLRDPYLTAGPPKTAGREQFGGAYVDRVARWARAYRARSEDTIRTATVFTSLSIADAFRRFILPKERIEEMIVAGGGARNPLLMAQLAAALPEIAFLEAERFGVSPEAKEAFAFAILAYEAFHGRANNLPAATGARFAVCMGKRVAGAPAAC
ncbi:MAG TPA: anhydro-N-acetylmuramic acid kinase [Verrucomicrobiae bacterium]|nr:anhydro-N-acetylmuramic acid kinase [Verrucomicrobiae bacterium]